MKRLNLYLAAMTLCVMGVNAQKQDGSISDKMLERIRESYQGTPEQKAVKNALASNSIAALAINSENLSMIDTHFSHRVKTKGITNQKSSGRCWLFTGLNVLRAKMIDKYDLPGFEFSQNYNSFYDLLEKSNLFLQGIIDTRELPLDDSTFTTGTVFLSGQTTDNIGLEKLYLQITNMNANQSEIPMDLAKQQKVL